MQHSSPGCQASIVCSQCCLADVHPHNLLNFSALRTLTTNFNSNYQIVDNMRAVCENGLPVQALENLDPGICMLAKIWKDHNLHDKYCVSHALQTSWIDMTGPKLVRLRGACSGLHVTDLQQCHQYIVYYSITCEVNSVAIATTTHVYPAACTNKLRSKTRMGSYLVYTCQALPYNACWLIACPLHLFLTLMATTCMNNLQVWV